MAKITLNYEQAHNFVEKNKKEGFFWDGYTIVRWAPSKSAFMDPKGMFRNNKWGFANRYRLKSDGTWDVSDKYAQLI
jgi:hypothetical protein